MYGCFAAKGVSSHRFIHVFVSYTCMFCFSDGGGDGIEFGPAPTQPDRLEPEEPDVDEEDLSSSDIRDFFPETWVWEILRTK